MIRAPLTANQRRGFLAAWGGWVLDGMDSFIYALVMVPALRELLPRSGIAADQSHIGFYGGLLFALFLVGWGCSLVWGPIADRFGRLRALMFTILCYSIFTFLGAFATSVWTLAAFRLLAGVGIGGEWSMGGTFIAEELPETRRKMAAGLMHTGYYVGIFLAAIANYFIGARFGWRAMFVVGGTPALLVSFIRYGVKESKRWEKRIAQVGRTWAVQRAFFALFSPEYRRRQLCDVHALAAGTVPDGMPGQRVCLCHFDRALCRRRNHFSGGRRRRLLSHDRDARGPDVAGVSRRSAAPAVWKRDERCAAAGLIDDSTIHDLRLTHHVRTRPC